MLMRLGNTAMDYKFRSIFVFTLQLIEKGIETCLLDFPSQPRTKKSLGLTSPLTQPALHAVFT